MTARCHRRAHGYPHTKLFGEHRTLTEQMDVLISEPFELRTTPSRSWPHAKDAKDAKAEGKTP